MLKPLSKMRKTSKEPSSDNQSIHTQSQSHEDGDITPMPLITKHPKITCDVSKDSKRPSLFKGTPSKHPQEIVSAQVITTTKKDFDQRGASKGEGLHGPLSNILGLTQTISSTFFDESPLKLVSSPLEEMGGGSSLSTIRIGKGNVQVTRVPKLMPRKTPMDF